jgi:hypothetical protein
MFIQSVNSFLVEMQLYTVWEASGKLDSKEAKESYLGTGIDEKCLMNEEGDYVGQDTGQIYPRDKHYHSDQLIGIIITVDEDNKTGMMHLDGPAWADDSEINEKTMKARYTGCRVTLESAHFADGIAVYRCLELREYFSELEVKIEPTNE